MNRALHPLALAASLAATVTALAASLNTAPILGNGPAATMQQEEASKTLVLQFMREFFNHGTMTASQAAAAYLAHDFQNHDPDEPSGAQGFAGFVSRGRGASATPRPATPEPLRLLVMTEGNLTLFVYPNRNQADPGASFGSNLFEHRNGKLTAWWYSGPQAGQTPPAPAGVPAGAPAPGGAPGAAAPAAAAPADYSKLYQGYTASTGAQIVIGNGTASAAERAAHRRLALAFWNEFFVQQKAAAAAKYLSPELTNHSPGQPSGAEFAAYAVRNPFNVTAQKLDRLLFAIADGELVALGFPFPVNGDPGAHYIVNVVRVKNGRIVEWWYSGQPQPYPKAPAGGVPDGKYVAVKE